MISYSGLKIRLRPLRAADQEQSIIWRNDPRVREMALGYRFPVTQAMEQDWFAAALNDQSRTRVIFTIEDLADEKAVGFIQLTRLDWVARLGWLAIVVGEVERHGRGLGSEAMQLLFTYAFEGLNLRKICLEVPAYNARGRAAYERMGFRLEGTLREQVFLEGNYHDLLVMGLMRAEFYSSAGSEPAGREPA